MRRMVLLFCCGLPCGCAGFGEVYVHDPQLAAIAADAEASFAASASDGLWRTMSDNVEATARAEQAVLARSAQQRFEGQIQNIENLSWQRLVDCGRGLCWPVGGAAGLDPSTFEQGLLQSRSTEEKIAYLTGRSTEIAADIESLRQRIAEHVPVSETSPLTVSSSVNDAISAVEQRIAEIDERFEEFKRGKISELESGLDEILEPILNPFPEARAEILAAVNDGLAQIRAVLEGVASARALPGEAAESLLEAAEEALPDDVPGAARSLLAARLNELFEIGAANSGLAGLLGELDGMLEAANGEVDRIDDALATALGGSNQISTRFRAVNDLLRKSDHLDLVRLQSVEDMLDEEGRARLQAFDDELSLSAKLDELSDAELSAEFSAALSEAAQRPVCSECTVGDVLDYLKTDESKLQGIRTRLRDDFRRTTITAYNYELETHRRELALMEDLLGIASLQHQAQMGFSRQIDAHVSRFGIEDLGSTIFHELDCLARAAGQADGEGCAADTREARDQFASTLVVLASYFSLEGDLREREIGLWVELARMRHRRSIEASRIAALGHEQLIGSGLAGLTAFTQGGVTSEQIASVLRLFNTSLLAVIAGEN